MKKYPKTEHYTHLFDKTFRYQSLKINIKLIISNAGRGICFLPTLVLLFFLGATNAFPKYTNTTHSPDIKSVQIYKSGWELAQPIIKLFSSDEIKASFDDLSGNAESYNYTIIHCTPDWEESGLSPVEYLNGFAVNQILNYKYSFNTSYQYVHYELTLPNSDVKFRISGNYILKVTKVGEEKTSFTRRFYVYENQTSVYATIKSPLSSNTYATHQEVNFNIDFSNLKISNPLQDLSVVVQQNGREDNICANVSPTFIRSNELVYNSSTSTTFEGCNEFRWIDIRSFRYLSDRSVRNDFFEPFYHVTIMQEAIRNNTDYQYRKDFNGRYILATTNGGDPNQEGDYAIVHFSIPLDAPFIDATVHACGEAFGWMPSIENTFQYNFNTHCYELSTLLKQGIYDYLIGVKEKNSAQIDFQRFEGNYALTDNQYTFFVYLKQLGDSYAQLVGVNFVSTNQK